MPNRLYNKQVTPKGYKAGGSVKEEPMRDRMKQPLKRKAGPKAGRPKPTPSKQRKMGAGAIAKRKKPEIVLSIPNQQGPANKYSKEFVLKKAGGRALKPVNPQTQKGLSKLPTEVRNKMGYMKKGGKVHGK